MTPNLGNRFQSFRLEDEERVLAKAVSPYFYAYLQNKISDYAHAVVEYTRDDGDTPEIAVLEHEKLKAQVLVLEELMRELTPPVEQTEPPSVQS